MHRRAQLAIQLIEQPINPFSSPPSQATARTPSAIPHIRREFHR